MVVVDVEPVTINSSLDFAKEEFYYYPQQQQYNSKVLSLVKPKPIYIMMMMGCYFLESITSCTEIHLRTLIDCSSVQYTRGANNICVQNVDER